MRSDVLRLGWGPWSPEEMKEWGGSDPGATWQRADNSGIGLPSWLSTLAPHPEVSVLFEGQMRNGPL